MKASTITPENINTMVISFYTKVLNDKQIGPFFTHMLGDDIENEKWQEHIELLTDFWCTMILKMTDYNGSPFSPHAEMKGLTIDSFKSWMGIFKETLNEIYDKNSADQFLHVANIMSNNFIENLGLK